MSQSTTLSLARYTLATGVIACAAVLYSLVLPAAALAITDESPCVPTDVDNPDRPVVDFECPEDDQGGEEGEEGEEGGNPCQTAGAQGGDDVASGEGTPDSCTDDDATGDGDVKGTALDSGTSAGPEAAITAVDAPATPSYDLPFTGANVVLALLLGCSLIAGGAAMYASSRAR